ncbi:MAG: hypothetical protein AMXMBFR33_13910 [Candidatus Xenobia bacterium]
MIQSHFHLTDRVTFSWPTQSAPFAPEQPRDVVLLGERPEPAPLMERPVPSEAPLPTLRGERELQRLARLAEVRGYRDGLGLGLDEGIVDTVAALQLNGFNTRQSCEGHVDTGCGAPWVDIQAVEPPNVFSDLPNALHKMAQFHGQRETYEKVARENGLSLAQLVDRSSYDEHEELLIEASGRSRAGGETPEFQAWVASNHALKAQFEDLVGTYNAQNHQADRIGIEPSGFGTFRIYSGSEADLNRNFRTQSEADRAALAERLAASRQSMQKFADYLTERFLGTGTAVR